MVTSLLLFINQIAIALYIFIGIGILWYSRKAFLHQTELRSTYFELERDIARFRRANSWTIVIILFEIALIILGIQAAVVPLIIDDQAFVQAVNTVADGDFATFTPAPQSGSLGIEPETGLRDEESLAIIQITPTLTPTPVGTILPAPNPTGCDTDNAFLQIPANGMRVFQPIPIVGTAFTDDFGEIKLEISGASTFDNFVVISTIRTPITSLSEFSQFNPAQYTPGQYKFRLMVFDISNTLKASCMIYIDISQPIPTITPTLIPGV
ncbi:hypothetical protein MASR2M15_10870 [Anaerolineales bacterium]